MAAAAAAASQDGGGGASTPLSIVARTWSGNGGGGGGGGGHVELGASVIRIERVSRHLVHCVTHDQRAFRGKSVVVAANSCNFIKSCEFVPRLPLNVEQYARRAYNAAYGKAVLVYDRWWWRDAGFSGMHTSASGLVISSSYDYCAPPLFALVCFFAGEQANVAAMMTETERKARCLTDLKMFFPPSLHKQVDSFAYYHEKLWNADPIARGCSSILFPPGSFLDYCPSKTFSGQSRVPLGEDSHVYFAGTELAHEFVGYMEGAIRSGKETALQVLDALGGRDESVQV
jgi:monoamine oxidase